MVGAVGVGGKTLVPRGGVQPREGLDIAVWFSMAQRFTKIGVRAADASTGTFRLKTFLTGEDRDSMQLHVQSGSVASSAFAKSTVP